jgi:uncharacterized protein (DUF1697 family)
MEKPEIEKVWTSLSGDESQAQKERELAFSMFREALDIPAVKALLEAKVGDERVARKTLFHDGFIMAVLFVLGKIRAREFVVFEVQGKNN